MRDFRSALLLCSRYSPVLLHRLAHGAVREGDRPRSKSPAGEASFSQNLLAKRRPHSHAATRSGDSEVGNVSYGSTAVRLKASKCCPDCLR